MHRVYRIFRKILQGSFYFDGGWVRWLELDRVSVALQCYVDLFGSGEESGAQCKRARDSKPQKAGPGAGGSPRAGI